MGFVSNSDDIFVCSVQDVDHGLDDGWAESLSEQLRRFVSHRLKQNCSIWSDRQVASSVSFSDPERLADAAIVVLILTPAFVGSKWCVEEEYLKAFERHKEDGKLIFLVEQTRIDSNELPSQFGESHVSRFWQLDISGQPLTLVAKSESGQHNHRYIDELDHLACTIEAELRRQKKGQSVSSHERDANEQSSPVPTVFLAEVTDDLIPLASQLVRYLENMSLRVVPRNWITSPEMYVDHVKEHLATADIFVQILSDVRGRDVPGTQESRASLQLRLAKHLKLKTLQWCSRDILEDAKRRVADDSHRQFLMQNPLQASEFEDFKEYVVQKATAKSDEYSQASSFGGDAYIFVDTETQNREVAKELCNYLDGNCHWAESKRSGRPKDIAKDWTENLLHCDGMLVVYDQKDNYWIHKELRLVNKTLIAHKKRLDERLGIYEGPPSYKDDVRVKLHRMRVLNCRNGLNRAELERFLKDVEHSVKDKDTANARKDLNKELEKFLIDVEHFAKDENTADERPSESAKLLDVFLSYNRKDQWFVEAVYELLRHCDLNPWLDKRAMDAGQLFQNEIQNTVRQTDAAAIFIGKNGIGKWQRFEILTISSQFVEREIPVIPVLLPGVSEIPHEMPILREYNSVSFRNIEDDEALEKLIRGIKRRPK